MNPASTWYFDHEGFHFSMGKYRWYLLNEVIWCYLYDVALTAWKPVFLGPLLAGFSRSLICFSHLGSWLTFAAATIFTVNSGLGLVTACFYRFAQVTSVWVNRRVYFNWTTVRSLNRIERN